MRKNRTVVDYLRALFFLGCVFFFLCLPAMAVDLTLGWDPNTEPDLEGYAVYVRKNAVPKNANLDGHVAAADLDDPSSPQYTITGLEKNTRYYLALKAYDSAGNYSAFSDALCVDVGDTIGLCSDAGDNSGGSGGGTNSGGGGGGGCFISAAADGQID
jgi:uncharacterized membrane protein YgcG